MRSSDRRLSIEAGALALAFAAACGSPQASTPPPEPVPPPGTEHVGGPTLPTPISGHVVEGFWVTDDSPPPLACVADADCVYGGTVDDTGCCWSYRDMNASAQSRAYSTWLASFRERSCASAECPSPPVPSQPPDCLFAVRCDATSGAGVCVNACTLLMVPGTS